MIFKALSEATIQYTIDLLSNRSMVSHFIVHDMKSHLWVWPGGQYVIWILLALLVYPPNSDCRGSLRSTQEIPAEADTLYFRACYDSCASKCESLLTSSDTAVTAWTAKCHQLIGRCRLEQARYNEAEDELKQALKIDETLGSDSSGELLATLDLLSDLYVKTWRFSELDSYLNRSVAIRRSQLGEGNPDIYGGLESLIRHCGENGSGWINPLSEKLLSYWDSNTEIQELITAAASGQLRADTTDIRRLILVSLAYFSAGRIDQAGPLILHACESQRAMTGIGDLDRAFGLMVLAEIQSFQGVQVDSTVAEALRLRIAAAGPQHPLVGLTWMAWSSFDKDQNWAIRDFRLKTGLEILESTLAPDHPYIGHLLNILGQLYGHQGRFEEAEAALTRALHLYENKFGPDHPLVAPVSRNVANIYNVAGRYSEAETLYRRAIVIFHREPRYPNRMFLLGLTLGSLADMLTDEARYPEATLVIQQSLAMDSLVDKEGSILTLWDLNRLMTVLQAQDRDTELNSVMHSMTEIMHKYATQRFWQLAVMQMTLGQAELAQGNEAAADSLCREAIAAFAEISGPASVNSATGYAALATILHRQGRFDAAREKYQQALDIFRESLGAEHPWTASANENMAMLRCDQRDWLEAAKLESRSYETIRRIFRGSYSALTENQALEFSTSFRRTVSNYLSILLSGTEAIPDYRTQVARIVFSTKGQVSDCMIRREQVSIHTSSAGSSDTADSLKQARAVLARLYMENRKGNHDAGLEAAASRVERLEEQRARQSADSAVAPHLWDVTPPEIAGVIPEGAVLVDFLRYDHYVDARQTEPAYLAIVLHAGWEPQVFSLGPALAIDTAVWYYRRNFQHPSSLSQEDYLRAAENLYGLVWRPFATYLERASTVFIAPDGNLNLVSFAGLVNDSGKYLIEEFPIHYLSTGRDLLHFRAPTHSGKGLIAIGDPDFDASCRSSADSAGASVPEQTRPVRSTGANFGSFCAAALPGTLAEVNSVTRRWRLDRDEPVSVFLSGDATEENFKRSAAGSRMIYLATHGFYFPDSSSTDRPPHSLNERIDRSIRENPLLHCGFLLAGANRFGDGLNHGPCDDGIITAEEVAGLNLTGTELVVLSACESGLGRVHLGEGVFGLRRAFQLAGVRTVISALWPIDDQSTADYMGPLFAEGTKSIPHTLQKNALSQLALRRAQGKSDHPFYWAAFIATGDWQLRE